MEFRWKYTIGDSRSGWLFTAHASGSVILGIGNLVNSIAKAPGREYDKCTPGNRFVPCGPIQQIRWVYARSVQFEGQYQAGKSVLRKTLYRSSRCMRIIYTVMLIVFLPPQWYRFFLHLNPIPPVSFKITQIDWIAYGAGAETRQEGL